MRISKNMALAVLLSLAATAAWAQKAELSVDVSRSIGTLKPLRGVNGAPDMSFAGSQATAFGPPRAANISEGYRQAAINLVRTHDSHGAADIDSNRGSLAKLNTPIPTGDPGRPEFNIFPDLSKDPTLPESYNFAPTDKLISGIRAVGADVMFRLGRGGGTTAEPPQDLAKYGEIIRHIVLHYNKGWANGFQNSVKYWQVWNEPDLGEIWWRGTPQQYYALYEAAARAVKSADETALIGGATLALPYQTQPYREGFLDYLREKRIPLDFFSWHVYSDANDPYDFVVVGRQIREVLDRYGFRSTLSSLDEWNGSLAGMIMATDANKAAFVTSALSYMQDAPIDLQAYYRADFDFGPDGRTPTKVGQALIAHGRMARSPNRLTTHGGDSNGLAIQAGKSDDGSLVQILVSNYEIPRDHKGLRNSPEGIAVPGMVTLALPPLRSVSYGNNRGYRLTVKGLEEGTYEVEHHRITNGRDFESIEQQTHRGPQLLLTSDLPPPAVELIVIRRAP